jgi:hypothetical protein
VQGEYLCHSDLLLFSESSEWATQEADELNVGVVTEQIADVNCMLHNRTEATPAALTRQPHPRRTW